MLELEYNNYIDGVMRKIQSAISLTDFEVDIVKEVLLSLNKPLPSTRVGAQTRLNELDVCRLKLTNLIYVVSEKAVVHTDEYKRIYEPEFVRLTRAGRPNQAAIESEIHLNPAIFDKRSLVNNFDIVKSLLYGYLKTIDQVKQSVMKYDYNI